MRFPIAAAALLALPLACTHHIERKTATALATVDHEAPFLKVHMMNGDLFVLSKWRVDEQRGRIAGTGEQLGADRMVVRRGAHDIAMADVALYETNEISASPSVGALAVITGASIALTI